MQIDPPKRNSQQPIEQPRRNSERRMLEITNPTVWQGQSPPRILGAVPHAHINHPLLQLNTHTQHVVVVLLAHSTRCMEHGPQTRTHHKPAGVAGTPHLVGASSTRAADAKSATDSMWELRQTIRIHEATTQRTLTHPQRRDQQQWIKTAVCTPLNRNMLPNFKSHCHSYRTSTRAPNYQSQVFPLMPGEAAAPLCTQPVSTPCDANSASLH